MGPVFRVVVVAFAGDLMAAARTAGLLRGTGGSLEQQAEARDRLRGRQARLPVAEPMFEPSQRLHLVFFFRGGWGVVETPLGPGSAPIHPDRSTFTSWTPRVADLYQQAEESGGAHGCGGVRDKIPQEQRGCTPRRGASAFAFALVGLP